MSPYHSHATLMTKEAWDSHVSFLWWFCNSCFSLPWHWRCPKPGHPQLCPGHRVPNTPRTAVGFMPLDQAEKEWAEADQQMGLHKSARASCEGYIIAGASERMFQPTVHSESNHWWHFFTPSSSSERNWQVLRGLYVGGRKTRSGVCFHAMN